MIDKLTAAESTFREMQLRMSDPDIAGNSTEFQKVAKAAADLERVAMTFAQVLRDFTFWYATVMKIMMLLRKNQTVLL
jgi:protein subunit release factor A